MEKMTLNEILNNVNSKRSFLYFVQALKEDKMNEEAKEKTNPSSPFSAGANGWENGDIITFLDAIESYGEDSKHIEEEPNWKSFALLLFAGKF
jgi:hypothetical protein